jgi:hypothetical protein
VRFGSTDSADHKICDLTDLKAVIHPFYSVQEEFGYSDATSKNNQLGRVSSLFENAENVITNLKIVEDYYKKASRNIPEFLELGSDFVLPVFAINCTDRESMNQRIKLNFENRDGFLLDRLYSTEHPSSAWVWETLTDIFKRSLGASNDFVIICNEQHVFSNQFEYKYLIKNIIEGYCQNADVLCGGIDGGASYAMKISENRFWLNSFFPLRFVVFYRKFYKKFIDNPFSESSSIFSQIANLSKGVMVIHPPVSIPYRSNDVIIEIEQHSIVEQTDRLLDTVGRVYDRLR